MNTLNFLVIGKNQEILETLKRIIENNEGWNAEIQTDENICYDYVKENQVDVVLLSSGLEVEFENEIKIFCKNLDKEVKVIDHYGGGSGLLKNEVYSLFPNLQP
jgi:PleD family two-component response regulator